MTKEQRKEFSRIKNKLRNLYTDKDALNAAILKELETFSENDKEFYQPIIDSLNEGKIYKQQKMKERANYHVYTERSILKAATEKQMPNEIQNKCKEVIEKIAYR